MYKARLKLGILNHSAIFFIFIKHMFLSVAYLSQYIINISKAYETDHRGCTARVSLHAGSSNTGFDDGLLLYGEYWQAAGKVSLPGMH